MSSNHKILPVFWAIATICATTQTHAASTPFSQYGLIQNAQNYSSNPFYTPGTYGASYPKIVYNSGPALKPADCQVTVAALIQNICATHNNCRNTTLADIRPEIMVALSKLPVYNYVSSCAGYIDGEYQKYIKPNSNTTATESARLVMPTINATGNATKTTFPTGTPINQTTKKQTEYEKRAAELKSLQDKTKTSTDNITSTAFPKTFDDLSMAEKNEIKRTGYEPYKDAQTYIPLNITPDENLYKDASDALCDDIATVYTCIKQYDNKEKAAENAFFNASDNTDKANQLKTAIQDAILSGCTCTANRRFTEQIRQILNVQCSTDAETAAESEANQYVQNLLNSVSGS